ncbi:hypothetical protein GCM10011390_28130 [Aureimonas endophytica]|uniref:Zeta toxin domain-containing protein n=1 Tax=Aureimonas endophytica TaxID=2027858 RepID=A0A916ZQ87_9HYPH|nr:zeta toxin family protein [Aureimonas endophytica]GGE07447.1 hypothetical protein GCM10011390_28130 [Aureimonas endophytica]
MGEEPSPTAFCTIVAGPNGSGKSTLYPLLSPVGTFINADIVARNLAPQRPETASLAAGRLVLAAIAEAMSRRRSFVYETTLSSHQSLAVMRQCRALGYEVALVFVALDSPELNIRRVAERVARGGHHIAEEVIRRRYETAFRRLPSAFALADTSLVFDNSGLQPETVLVIDRHRVVVNRLEKTVPLHQRLAGAVADAFSEDLNALI